MIEPLSLKSEPASAELNKKNNLLTASQLLSQFSLKSPSATRICLTDRQHSNSKMFSTPKVQTKQISMFRKVKDSHAEPSLKKEIVGKQVKTASNNCRQNIVRIINQKSTKRSKGKDIERRNKENRCPTERSTPGKSHALKFNVCLENKASLPPLTARSNHEEKYFRKSSDASTLSLRTKHTASQQHQDEDELFHQHSSQINVEPKQNENVLKTLQFAKKKLYQQIYNLDKKLLNEYTDQDGEDAKPIKKKQITISLKRKEEVLG